MYTTFGFRNLGRQVILEDGWRHIASKRRDMSRCLWDPILLDTFCCHNSSKWKLHSIPPPLRLLRAWSSWTEIRALSRAIRFSQLVWTFKNWNTAYWGRKNSRFGQWEYFGNWRDNFLVQKAEDASSDARQSFGTSESEGRVVRSPYKLYISNNKNL
jgi:hypothetical protein